MPQHSPSNSICHRDLDDAIRWHKGGVNPYLRLHDTLCIVDVMQFFNRANNVLPSNLNRNCLRRVIVLRG